jgi:hypothetical protein
MILDVEGGVCENLEWKLWDWLGRITSSRDGEGWDPPYSPTTPFHRQTWCCVKRERRTKMYAESALWEWLLSVDENELTRHV